ncbi:hypothetical protein D0X99_01235 [Algoriphagus lacus]|uniref:SGNH/GDSL hydrolase family protein n=1 Tax=Algoriphagus lacus TaxID=2056311 RepID=A0A418PVZ1_9BACT|nr:hypothetical protein [Algoriphagus lacus]RIW18347.1 hypothetical protein D0X99_01235 [Algoriphagus lacus]
MKKFVIKSTFYLLGLLFLAYGLSLMGLYTLKRSQFFKPSFLVNAFKPGEQFKLAVFGSSRGLASLDTKLIADELEGLSANFSMDYTALPTAKLMLEHFYAQGYRAEFIVISVDLPDRDTSKTVISENDYRFLPFRNESYVQNYYSRYDEGLVKPLAASGSFPFFGFGYYNMELLGPTLISSIKPDYRYQFDELGNFEYPDYLGMDEKPEPRNFQTALTNPILKEIQELTIRNSSKLIIYIAPYLRDEINLLESCPYTVINHSRLINKPNYFSDYIHVVNSGKKIATKAFIEELKKLE